MSLVKTEETVSFVSMDSGGNVQSKGDPSGIKGANQNGLASTYDPSGIKDLSPNGLGDTYVPPEEEATVYSPYHFQMTSNGAGLLLVVASELSKSLTDYAIANYQQRAKSVSIQMDQLDNEMESIVNEAEDNADATRLQAAGTMSEGVGSLSGAAAGAASGYKTSCDIADVGAQQKVLQEANGAGIAQNSVAANGTSITSAPKSYAEEGLNKAGNPPTADQIARRRQNMDHARNGTGTPEQRERGQRYLAADKIDARNSTRQAEMMKGDEYKSVLLKPAERGSLERPINENSYIERRDVSPGVRPDDAEIARREACVAKAKDATATDMRTHGRISDESFNDPEIHEGLKYIHADRMDSTNVHAQHTFFNETEAPGFFGRNGLNPYNSKNSSTLRESAGADYFENNRILRRNADGKLVPDVNYEKATSDLASSSQRLESARLTNIQIKSALYSGLGHLAKGGLDMASAAYTEAAGEERANQAAARATQSIQEQAARTYESNAVSMGTNKVDKIFDAVESANQTQAVHV